MNAPAQILEVDRPAGDVAAALLFFTAAWASVADVHARAGKWSRGDVRTALDELVTAGRAEARGAYSERRFRSKAVRP